MKRTIRRAPGTSASDWACALVTGASSGIGEAIALQLAAAGVDVVVVGRDTDRLQLVASAAREHGVRVEVICADLATAAGVDRVEARLREGEPTVDLLVNNAGTGQYGRFVDLPTEGAIDVLRVNAEALVRLTSGALERMRQHGSGTVVQISSTASAAPSANQAVYAATKAFVASFGQAISQELQGTGISCTTVLPGRTRTRYFERVGSPTDVPESRWMSADDVARATIAAARDGVPVMIVGRNNRMHVALATLFPTLPVGRVLAFVRRLLVAASQAGRAARHAIVGLRAGLRIGR